MASAMGNLVPAITFVMAFLIGPEKINIRSFRSVAKIVGTVICVSGAISMALLRGPKLLNTTIFESGGEDWLLGCLLIFASTFCWSIWLILQVPVTASYPDHLSLSAWLCFLATLQSGILTLFLEKDLDAWKLHSYLEVAGCLFTGIIGSGISFFVQAWVISQRGPLFSAMFNPLSTVIVTVLAAIFLHEEIYTGSLIGAVSVIIGLYIVLWGKAKDFIKEEDEVDPKLEIDERQTVKITIEESRGVEPFLEEPLLSDKSNDIEESILVRLRIEHDTVISLKKFIAQLVHIKFSIISRNLLQGRVVWRRHWTFPMLFRHSKPNKGQKLPSRRPVRSNPAYVSNTLKTTVSLVMISLVRSPLLSN
ncbi:hypothetical protein NC651_038845 [Populus alba x Populus x berolinensis]|nr:hypothetical protein NC651_038845 [Populus alba x Populus x berolinensis]